MRSGLVILSLATIGMAISSHSLNALVEIPKRSSEELHREASLVVTGIVHRTYERDQKRKHIVHTFGVAEIVVKSVSKGENIAVGDRVFVRYWRDTKLDTKRVAPGHYGHWNVPAEGETVVVYSKGDKKEGLDVLSPNGFYEVLEPVSGTEPANVK